MKIRYDTNKLQKIVADIALLTGISITFMDMQHNYLCYCSTAHTYCETVQKADFSHRCYCADSALRQRCNQSGRFESHICYAGLFDAIVPIRKNNILVGYIYMGRVRTEESPLCPYPKGSVLQNLYDEVPILSNLQVESLKSLISDVLFEGAISFQCDEIIEMVETYLENHLHEPLGVDSVCKRFFISKNSLYKLFRIHRNCTVVEYITQKRLEKAKKLLIETDRSVCDIAEAVGVSNYTYFCRLFKKKEGMSPMQYRRSGEKCEE